VGIQDNPAVFTDANNPIADEQVRPMCFLFAQDKRATMLEIQLYGLRHGIENAWITSTA
jgi:hypothetical protein